MNWKRIGPYILDAGNGYRICKTLISGTAHYRASDNGAFIGPPVASAEEAKAQAKQHRAEQ